MSKPLYCSVLALLVAGCAGSPPDFRARIEGIDAKQNQFAQWLTEDSKAESLTQIAASVCSSSSTGHPPEGWALEEDNWCVVTCPVDPPDNVFDRWMLTHDGLRCFSIKDKSTRLINTELDRGRLDLESQLLFTGFDRSFVSNTHWECTEQEYQIDPDSKQGFWATLDTIGTTYSFYDDGALMIGQVGLPMKFAGDWRGGESGNDSGIVINDREMFRYAVNFDGGRFDEFRSATRKQVCRFKDHPGPRL